ncbi:probable Exosome complex component RRP4 [Saccharomycodes ludwigii]|uniref:Probable Exosome complex component RRP4 n=1 Tax=Saccharomycodes ludwigii TaxID=36035 RepID=A0A376BBD1_9ASCO|nr:hypothetical protein SCDLUD_004656 [Saccharomycodes ludwigii]KAH3899224.1 hypothetical protein SCDLUD_004656 [Saccharomycodes ludwigii]SSD61995.1 probable Exosome complex component RRP4 [Saccharomycodes ludwigii]
MSTPVISIVKRSTGTLIPDSNDYYDNANGIDNSDSDSDIEMLDNDNNNDINKTGIVTPGELVTDDPVWMRGHGTYSLQNKTYSSVCGTVSRVNKLLSVIPLRGRYQPETGDHVIGRITEVGNKRWKVAIGAKQDAVLMLGSVNLPGGVLRRKSESDELQMRNFLKEGDLLNAEVQSLFQDGAAALHTRSLKYGKLRNGFFLEVPNSLIIRSKDHTHDLPGGVTVILGVNGYIWLRKTSNNNARANVSLSGKNANTLKNISRGTALTTKRGVSDELQLGITRLEEESSWEIYSDKNDDISFSIKQTITRYANVIKSLAHCEIGINEQRIIAAYEASLAYPDLSSLVETETMESLGQDVINGEKIRGSA